MKRNQRNRQCNDQRQKSDTDIGQSPAIGVNERFRQQLRNGAANAGAHQRHPQRQTAFFMEPPGDGFGESDRQGACTENRQ